MAASFGSEGAESANAIAPPAAPGKASSSSGEIDFKDEAKIRGMELISCTRDDNGRVSLTLDLGKGRQFVLSGVPGQGPFSVSTVNPFLLDGLFVENLEEIQSQAKRIQEMSARSNQKLIDGRDNISTPNFCEEVTPSVMSTSTFWDGFLNRPRPGRSQMTFTTSSRQEVMSAAAEVHMCISGEGDEDEDGEGGEDKYEYDFGGIELMMEDDKAKRTSSDQDDGLVYEDTDISKMLGGMASNALTGNAGGGKSSVHSNQNTRLMRDLSRLMRSNTEKLGFSLQLKNDDELNEWSINLFGFSDCPLAEDMKRLEKDMKVDHIRLLMTFKQDYPFSPPFVRVVYPRFKQSTGYIIDGAFCMELLTNQGWTPTNDIESVVVQIRAQMVVGKARIDFDSFSVTQPYPEDRAKAAFRSAAKIHKWAISEP